MLPEEQGLPGTDSTDAAGGQGQGRWQFCLWLCDSASAAPPWTWAAPGTLLGWVRSQCEPEPQISSRSLFPAPVPSVPTHCPDPVDSAGEILASTAWWVVVGFWGRWGATGRLRGLVPAEMRLPDPGSCPGFS